VSTPYRVPHCGARAEYGSRIDRGSFSITVGSLTRNLIVLLVLVGLFSYLILPGLIENQLAQRLQTAFGAPTKPVVEVSSGFPPVMLLGHIGRVRVAMDRAIVQGAVLYNARADLRGVEVSVPQLLQGNLTVTTKSCSLSVEAPPVFIDQNQACLNYLGFGTAY
jgi:hypothetical protein